MVHPKLTVVALSAAAATFVAGSAFAQDWEPTFTKELITGVPSDPSETDAIVIRGEELWYVDQAVSNPPPPAKVGGAKLAYQFPVEWHDDETAVYFADTPSASPTGSSIKVTVTVDAVAYDVDGAIYSGYVVGLVRTYSWSTGSESGEFTLFDPGAIASDKTEAREMVKSLATGPGMGKPPRTSGGQQECVDACEQTWKRESDTARNRWITRTKANCGVVAPLPSFIGGCVAGASICGWLLPPASTAVCCVLGGIVGSAVGTSGCAYIQHTEYQIELREAKQRFWNCLEDCGVLILEV